MNPEIPTPNESLRRARILRGWSQAELAEQVGTSFEMVSRWERGITVPSSRYRMRLSAALGKTAEELGLVRNLTEIFTSPLVLLAASHADAEQAIVSRLKIILQERGMTLWSSRQLGRQGTENSRTVLRGVVQAAQVILIFISPEARSSRHVRDAFEMARRYQRPVCGIWTSGKQWEHCLPDNRVELAALIDARKKDNTAILEEIVIALEKVSLTSSDAPEVTHASLPGTPTIAVPLTDSSAEIPLSMNQSEQGAELLFHQSQDTETVPTQSHSLEPTNGASPITQPLPTKPPPTSNRKGHSRIRMSLLVGIIAIVIAGSILGSLNFLTHFKLFDAYNRPSTLTPIHGGTWTLDYPADPDSLIPNSLDELLSKVIDQALYLPLFYGDSQGAIHPGAASEVPTVKNGGISIDAKTWTFHLRPHLVWSDGQPYDARDVDYTWKLWLNPKFGAHFPTGAAGFELIQSADVSVDHLSISFHLKQAYAPFLQYWVDGYFAPLPMHHFSRMAPEAIVKSPDTLNPQITSGPFRMWESVPGDHYTLERNPKYYRANEGLPYLDKVMFRITNADLKDLQAGTVDTALVDPNHLQVYQHFPGYTITTPPTSSAFEALYFNFHNTVLASHPEVRLAIAKAIDHQALVAAVPGGFAIQLCTDHSSAMHPGYQPVAFCPIFEPMAANKFLQDKGWVKGPDGVRMKDGQRLEFEYSTSATFDNIGRASAEIIIQHNLQAIGIKLDIQNYPKTTFFGPFLSGGKASPPIGAIAGRYDIAEWQQGFLYDPDDSFVLGCDQVPPKGINWTFYCNHALDDLYKQEQAAADPGVRQQIFNQIHQIYLTDFPFIVLYSPLDPTTMRKGTHNYQPSPIEGETVNIWEWWCDNGKC